MTISPCGVYLLYGGPFMFILLKLQLVCQFGIVEIHFLFISCLYSCFGTLPEFCIFPSQMFFLL